MEWAASSVRRDGEEDGRMTAGLPPESEADPGRSELDALDPALIHGALSEVKRVIVGQEHMVEQLMVALIAGGHCLLEGVPGVAKTLAVRTFADVVGGTFARIQFTPDLVPSDIVGTRIYRPSKEALRRRARPGVRQLRARRRDQPGAGQGAVGDARADGRAPGVDRRPDLPAARPVHRDRHPEPDRVRGRLPAAGGPARPVPAQGRRRLTRAGTRSSRSCGG